MPETVFEGYAFIIGAMKSGTTTLHAMLKRHPSIMASADKSLVKGGVKEPNFLRDEGNTSAEEYEAIYPKLNKSRHKWTLDGSTSYTKIGRWPRPPARIAALPGRKRLIYIMRDPVERIDSHIAHNVAKGRWNERDWPRDYLINVSAYATQLRAYERVGLLPDTLLLDFSELVTHPQRVVNRVCRFLGLENVSIEGREEPRNVRKINRRFVTPEEEKIYREELESDIVDLIEYFGFTPAENWLKRS